MSLLGLGFDKNSHNCNVAQGEQSLLPDLLIVKLTLVLAQRCTELSACTQPCCHSETDFFLFVYELANLDLQYVQVLLRP